MVGEFRTGHNNSISTTAQKATYSIDPSDGRVQTLHFHGGWPNLRPGDYITAEVIAADLIDKGISCHPSEGSRTPVWKKRGFKGEETAIKITTTYEYAQDPNNKNNGKITYSSGNERDLDKLVEIIKS